MDKDYYNILGVERDATADDIKSAYRLLAKEHHPDKNKDDPASLEKFKEINEANDVLKDPTKRTNYDQFGDPDGRPGFQGFRSSGEQSMDDIINEFLRGGGMHSSGFHFNQRPRNADLSAAAPITLEDAYSGTSFSIGLTDTTGATNDINITIPPGAVDRMMLRVKGKGLQQNTGLPPGNLNLQIQILPHHLFKVLGTDLYLSNTISMIDAALGCETQVSLLDGSTVSVTIPEGTQPNQKIRLKGKGMPDLNNPSIYGDLYINMSVVIPTNLTENQREILKNFGTA